MRRLIAGVLVTAAVALGTAACGNDNGGVIQGPTTTVGSKTGATRSSDYSG